MGVLGINHVAFRTVEPATLRRFYERLLGAEPLDGAHDPLRAGSVILVFFEGEPSRPGRPPGRAVPRSTRGASGGRR
jgi:catechol 2,3-dioxygenase-like lactoylglutathione lyase family enzyme